MNELPESAELYLDSNRGIYIPQNFIECTDPACLSNVDQQDINTLLQGPDDEWYWEAWTNILDNAILTEHRTGKQFNLYQDGDLWLIPVDAEWEPES